MRLFFLILLVFTQNIYAEDVFDKATILFNDGHEESGFITAFLEDTKRSGSLEKLLDLDDKSFKFKINESGGVKEIFTENVKQVSVFYSDGSSNVYEVVRLRDLDKAGKPLEEEVLVYLIPVKKGKVNIYGIKYHEVRMGTGERAYTKYYLGGKDYFFYYQNTKDSYAINYFNVGFGSIFKLKERMLAPLRNMCSDCKPALDYIESNINPSNIDKKAIKANDKILKKEFKSLPEEKQLDLKTLHYYECFELNELINMYETCN